MPYFVKKYYSLIFYIFFGIVTTIINISTYLLLLSVNLNNHISVVISWFLSVVFAYVSNKLWVFDSNFIFNNGLVIEFCLFLLTRITTLFLEMIIIWYSVQYLCQSPAVWKFIDNVFVVIINYLISKLIIFRKKR
ncbi:GtrA family protein [Weissella paramesenteroides]|uniref:GtrA family protein n=1 Tax=Weissella paramesenteroides TaxID=1249 RepID=UPI002072DBF6|nr:GtrA family protein [Weissella paramesenteroides]MCM6765526.1 GtrA family protein [Weissella paramesenteroides]MCM6766897.1 GtrA family protein [Weissella paramesenteroides]MCM6769301.1 GtrA family protein [Weissella paramesenteroides]MCM6771339.1 GtrA family protein [Weissella paramesenteroides]MCM6779568.1 GtrA family protein [Weissella paramesenteroides]